jgi:hypothetical protein
MSDTQKTTRQGRDDHMPDERRVREWALDLDHPFSLANEKRKFRITSTSSNDRPPIEHTSSGELP